jgi:prepilin-type processing-associated H-X9-DG protein
VPTGLNPLYWSVSGLGPAPASAGHDTSGMTGVIFERSMIRMVDVTRGPGQVYLLGEKYLNPQNYFTGADGGDNECMEVGQDNDICRDTSSPPLHDQSGNGDTQRFGSAHINGCNMAFCDGSVQFISYKISPAVHLAAGSRY